MIDSYLSYIDSTGYYTIDSNIKTSISDELYSVIELGKQDNQNYLETTN